MKKKEFKYVGCNEKEFQYIRKKSLYGRDAIEEFSSLNKYRKPRVKIKLKRVVPLLRKIKLKG